jgi:protein-disulfide isomerase
MKRRFCIFFTATLTLAVFCVISTKGYSAEACAPKPPEQYADLIRYIALRYRLPTESHLRIEKHEVVNEACFQKLTFKGDGPLGSYQLTMFASPDLRFVSSDLLDSYIDPEQERRETAQKTMGKLLEGEFASRGPIDAPVTLVVFSDFECPYCKQFSKVLADEPLLRNDKKVHLVFRHMPLAGHPWAAKAAKAAACAQFQGKSAFWSLHDSLFESQGRITVDNASREIMDLASRVKELNMEVFRKCVDQDMSLGVVIRDQDLAQRAGVIGTPSIFLNGEQIPRALDAPRFHEALLEAIDHNSSIAVRPAEAKRVEGLTDK